MHIFRSFLLLGCLTIALADLPLALAQDAASSPDFNSASTANPAANDLFPNGSEQSPATALSGRPGGGHHNGGGSRQHGGRRHEALTRQADSDPLALRVAYRRAKTIALAQDPGLGNLIRQAAVADTDVEKRAYLKEYYTRLFIAVRKIDPSPEMQAHVKLLTLLATQRYDPKRREVGGDEDIINGRGRGRRG